jgi:hypothetical protein
MISIWDIEPLREKDIQKRLCCWLRELINCGALKLPFFHFHSHPNERKSTPRHMNELKDMGLVPGISDLELTWIDNKFQLHILFLELKKKSGRLSKNQKIFRDMIEEINHPNITYSVAYSLSEAMNVIEEKLSG